MGTYTLQDRFFSIAWKISLYPLVMITINTVLVAGDVRLSFIDVSVDTPAELGLYVVYYTFYGARSIFIAAVS